METTPNTQAPSRPRFDPVRQEWSQRTGPNTWRVWQHGTLPNDDERLLEEAARELAREQRESGIAS